MDSHCRVLIVEDNYLLLDMLSRVFDQGGLSVVAVSSGEAALTSIRETGPTIDWLFTDINLPGLVDGWSVADAFRALHPRRPVVYASSGTYPRNRAVSDSLFVAKPFRMQPIAELARGIAAASGLRAAG
ncbi:response regulator receiver protein [Methylobacterium sp. Leaf469]|jgi:CheY-like chemotaxis protein|uniref:response regulator n=1 Tax=unclassified Methylobacterium TaxID=2615210 RepID=UPI0006FAAB20|nr:MULTISPECIES: response regulator [unclassified Methylobacterium]KQO72557.1 response regulator receiver protein [Methylobacterium sp. Leaf87]KQP24482.1 response regulator receiver protein [Methylobacterium sp. Leaf102]KQP60281.1 response regulator receiver protein [Methylobacterium sp. Leaf112]KQT93062.1 response regulator receiver protein [Methylobacterium sp. Leaf469]